MSPTPDAQRALVLATANQVALDILAQRTGVEALRHIADAARALAGARYAALGVARQDGQGLREFVTVGLTPAQEAQIGTRPRGAGVLGLLLSRTEPLRIDVLAHHPAAVGLPPGHPPMTSFLGVPLRRGGVVLGSLYLTDKQGGAPFTEADEAAVQALGAHAAVAIHHLHMLTRERGLVSGLMAAQEEERRAIAYDLHDGLTQYVMASHAHLEAAQRARETGQDARAAREWARGMGYLKDAVVEARRLIGGLRSLALDDLGLAGALEQLVDEERERAGWQDAEIVQAVAGRRFSRETETAAYRVAQEALTNARRHAGATRVRVTLSVEPAPDALRDCLVLEVQDWGCGFAPAPPAEEGAHVGLRSMEERAHILGGQCVVQSAPGAGTRVRAWFPLTQNGALP